MRTVIRQRLAGLAPSLWYIDLHNSATVTAMFTDLHSHVLPALDDGSPDLGTSLAMLRGLSALGYQHVAATPHQKSPDLMPARDAIDAAYETTRAALAAAGLTLSLSLGAENFWDEVFFARQQDGTIPGYGAGRAFLFEIGRTDSPVHLEQSLFQLRTRGLLPVMAHPERYAVFHKDLDRLAQIGQSCPLVVDLGALGGYHGLVCKRVARRLVLEGIAHAAASDVHGPADLRAVAAGIDWLRTKLGPDGALRLLARNPQAILAGEHPGAC